MYSWTSFIKVSHDCLLCTFDGHMLQPFNSLVHVLFCSKICCKCCTWWETQTV